MSDSPPLRVLVVDDERPAVQRLEDLLDDYDDVDLVGTRSTGRDAVEAIRENDVDLVFLDIQMPGLSGLDVVEEVGPEAMPAVIFVTAYDQHALRAFDVAAVDYLLKPFEDERFEEALDRARRQVRLEHVDELREQLMALLEATGRSGDASGGADADADADAEDDAEPGGAADTDGYLQRIPVRKAREVRVVSVDHVAYFQAEGPYVELHMADKARHLIRERMKTLEARLDPQQFCRIHRSTIINLDYVESVQPNYQDRYVVRLSTGTRLDVSRRRRADFEESFGLSF